MNTSVDYYFANQAQFAPAKASTSISKQKVQQLFEQYKNASGNMEEDEIARFFEDLGVDSFSDIVAILVSMHMKAETMGTYKFSEFLAGCEDLGVDSLAGWKEALKRLYAEL